MMKKIGEMVKNYFVNYFIPHAGNDNKPHILRPRAIAFVVMVALVAESAFVFGAKYIIPQSKFFGIIEVNALVDETNQNRVTNGLPDLQVSSALTVAAQDKANDEATKGYFAHTSPQGLTPWYWFQQVGYNFDYAGENLAVNFSDSEDVTTAWMNSPEHRANILNTDFTQIGIAAAQGVYEGEPTTFVVEEFGTPAPAAAPTPFVDTASAATAPAAAVVVTPVPVATPAPVVKPPAKTVAAKPATIPKVTPTPAPVAVATVPVVVAMQSSSAPAMQQMFIAVQGAATQTVPAVPTTVPATTSAPSVGTTAATAPLPAQSNIIQQLLSDPKALANDFYLFVMILFFIALTLNIFINIRVQYPKLIAGGLLVIVVAGLCIMLNQNIGFLHTVIL
jgi:hypothetical protein